MTDEIGKIYSLPTGIRVYYIKDTRGYYSFTLEDFNICPQFEGKVTLKSANIEDLYFLLQDIICEENL